MMRRGEKVVFQYLVKGIRDVYIPYITCRIQHHIKHRNRNRRGLLAQGLVGFVVGSIG